METISLYENVRRTCLSMAEIHVMVRKKRIDMLRNEIRDWVARKSLTEEEETSLNALLDEIPLEDE